MLRRHLPLVGSLGLVLLLAAAAPAAEREQGVKYARFQAGDKQAYGIVEGDRVRQLKGDLFGKWEKTDTTHALKDVKLLVPSVHPSKVLALAGNFRDHLGDRPAPQFPEPFFKAPSSLLEHEGEIIQPKDTEPVHYEAEVVVVIGRKAKRVSTEQALDYVLGITCGNDISARYWQRNDVQWWRAKAFDTFGPCGPWIVAGIDFGNLDMELRVNGEVRQKTNTGNMIHGIAETVSYISRHCTLEPGDLIYMGTPGKTQGMQPGDVVEVEIQNVGILRNKVVMEK